MKMLFGMLLVAMLLIAGCPGESPPTPQTGVPATGQPTGATPSQPGTEAPEAKPPGQETQEKGIFDEWDMQAMMAMGQPVYCTVTVREEGMTSTMKMWVKGESMRIESSSQYEGEAYQSTMIMKNDIIYMSEQGGMGMMEEGCDWQMLDNKKLEACMPEEDPSASYDIGTFDTGTYESPPYDYHCEYAVFGDEKFATPGKVCDLSQQLCDMYEMMESGTFPGMGAGMCAGLTGQDYADCIEAFAQYQ